MGLPAVDSAGRPCGGVLILSRLAMTAVELEDTPLDVHQERVAVVRLRRHKKRALDVACVYLDASDARAREELAEAVASFVASRGNEYLILGDWNCEPAETPTSDLLASAGQHLLDAAFVDWDDPPVTRTRWIDYGVASGPLGVRKRWTPASPARAITGSWGTSSPAGERPRSLSGRDTRRRRTTSS